MCQGLELLPPKTRMHNAQIPYITAICQSRLAYALHIYELQLLPHTFFKPPDTLCGPTKNYNDGGKQTTFQDTELHNLVLL